MHAKRGKHRRHQSHHHGHVIGNHCRSFGRSTRSKHNANSGAQATTTTTTTTAVCDRTGCTRARRESV